MILTSLVLLIFIPFVGFGANDSTVRIFSNDATAIWGNLGEIIVPSPDGTKAIVVKKGAESEGGNRVTVRAFNREFKTRIGFMVNSEVAWAPNSRSFFVTYSDGGNVGTYHTKIFYVEPNGLRTVEPVRDARKLFSPHCFSSESPNVGAIKWITPSRLLVALEVPPHGSCAAPGTFEAFEIDVPKSTVLRSYSQIEAKRLFLNSLGVELQNADDDCFKSPQLCSPTGLNISRHKQPRSSE